MAKPRTYRDAELDDLFVVVEIRVDHDRIRVSIDDLDLLAFDELLGLHQDVATEFGNQGCQGLAVEPGHFETQATVHAVGRELQGLLANVILTRDTVDVIRHLKRFKVD